MALRKTLSETRVFTRGLIIAHPLASYELRCFIIVGHLASYKSGCSIMVSPLATLGSGCLILKDKLRQRNEYKGNKVQLIQRKLQCNSIIHNYP